MGFTSFLILAIFIIGGLGKNLLLTSVLGFFVFLLANVFLLIRNRKINFPVGSNLYALFLLVLGVSIKFSWGREASFFYFLLFASSYLVWLYFFNSAKRFQHIDKIVIILGCVFAGIFLIDKFSGIYQVNFFSLFTPVFKSLNHNHIGDLWALVSIPVFKNFLERKNKLSLFLMLLGGYLLLVSSSRSAYLALFVGFYLLFFKNKKFLKAEFKYLFIILSILVFDLFLLASLNKTTIFSRTYFLVSVLGLLLYPLGVGMGNFSKLSLNTIGYFQNFPLQMNTAFFAHNIFFEIFAGVGLWGFIFVFWLTEVAFSFGKGKGNSFLCRILFYQLLVNFFFDFTYIIPTMLWLWFAFLGLGQANKIKTNEK